MTLSRDRIRHIRARRRALRSRVDTVGAFEAWEETCVPSYVHANRAAALVSWWRLFAAVDLAGRHTTWGPVLDFGASVGELAHVLPPEAAYEFVEIEDHAAAVCLENRPDAVRVTLEGAEDGRYAVIFALDSLEHNTSYPELLDALATKLAPGGILVLSGPTENALYKLGRAIARFDAHYHETNIHAIEATADKDWELVEGTTVPMGVPLFRLSVWRAR